MTAYRCAQRIGGRLFRMWGDASNWDIATRCPGMLVDHVPVIGAIAQFKSVNHVSYVAAMNANGQTAQRTTVCRKFMGSRAIWLPSSPDRSNSGCG
jgi:surface antigen